MVFLSTTRYYILMPVKLPSPFYKMCSCLELVVGIIVILDITFVYIIKFSVLKYETHPLNKAQ